MKKNISSTVRDAILPTVNELGYNLWDITYGKIGADYHLEITIDKEGGIDIEDCERVHRAIDPILDECDPIEGFYYLDVSSPGLERELRTEEHIMSFIGSRVEAKLFSPIDGRKSVIGTLKGFEEGCVTVEEAGEDISLSMDKISKLALSVFED